MDLRLPNFLLVGAPKCGTSAIAGCLAQHPEIYMCPIKEPKFFTAQFLSFPLRGPGDSFVENFTVKTMETYERLFRGVKNEKAIGEASVDNLYFHGDVIPAIRRILGDVKIIIVLRNPVERAFSAYKNLLRDSRETLTFEEGLQREPERKRKGYEYLWRYLDLGFYHAHVKAYLEGFTHVKVFILEHFKKGSFQMFSEICRFLKVDASFRPPRRPMGNVSGKPGSVWLQRPFNPTGFKGKAYKFLAMRRFNMDRIMSWVEPLRDWNIQPVYMKPETRALLRKTYAPDVEALAELLSVDLNVWREPEEITAVKGA